MIISKVKGLISIALAVFALNTNAALITSADVDSVNISAGTGWSWVNIDALFNGVTNDMTTQTERFIGYRNSGEVISETNPFIIDVGFNNSFTVESLSFFNDWGRLLEQQIEVIAIEFLNMGSVVSILNTSGLAQNTFDEVILGKGLSVANVDQMKFFINAIDGTNFEIREIVIEVADQVAAVEASAPALGVLIALVSFGLFFRRKV